jgi:hypothetical protein
MRSLARGSTTSGLIFCISGLSVSILLFLANNQMSQTAHKGLGTGLRLVFEATDWQKTSENHPPRSNRRAKFNPEPLRALVRNCRAPSKKVRKSSSSADHLFTIT